MFTKQHYQLIANLFNRWLKELGHLPTQEERQLISLYIEMFTQDNKNFKREAFLDAVWKGVL